METRWDFLNWLALDMSIKILMCLEDPSDIVRISAVSRSWRCFVIANGLCKRLCMRMFPQLSRVSHVVELDSELEPADVGSSNSIELETLERDHRVYAFLARGCKSFVVTDCIAEAISASSTDNYPDESINHTLEPRNRIGRRACYWSSKGQKNPAVPETLTYKLVSDFCVITKINIKPFEAYFQRGFPIYSAKYVRFRMGHPKSQIDIERGLMGEPSPDPADDKFIWTYTSQEFPMAQDNNLQGFKLPEPVLCIGGYLQIELLGRIQKQDMDGLFYICIAHVQVVGRSLWPIFDVEILEPSGKFLLKYCPHAQQCPLPSLPENDPSAISAFYLEKRARNLEQILSMLRGNFGDGEDNEWNEEDESDEDIIE